MISLLPIPVVAAEGGSDILTPDGSLLLILVLFLLFVPILNKILFKPITGVLDRRERMTGGSGLEVKGMIAEVGHKLSAYEDGIRAARAESYRVVEQHRAAALEERQAAIAAAREASEAKVAEARAALAREAEAARERLEGDAREVAAKISATVLGRAVGGATR